MKAMHLIVHGRVQAVGYRAFVKRNAEILGLIGWVKNRDDGSVEVWAEGTEEKLEMLLKQCKVGPGTATVKSIDKKEVSPIPMDHFEIRH